MNKQLLKIFRTATEVGEKTGHDIYVSYFSKSTAVQVQIYHGGFGFDKEPETLCSIFTKKEKILFHLVSLLNEERKEVAS